MSHHKNRGLRWDAKQRGDTRYFTGKPCKAGHIAERITVNGCCVVCAYETWKRTVASTPKRKAWEAARVRDPVKVRPIKAAWKKRNAAAESASSMKRIATKIKATPSWADHDAISSVYAECSKLSRETGIKHHVDHIVPLRGKNVCGLHVHWNLQILTASENCRKGNRLTHLMVDENFLQRAA